jgi:uncharacterized protein (DUF1501 family)
MNRDWDDCANHKEFLRRNANTNHARRFFLRSGAIALAGVGLAHTTPSFVQRAVFAQEATRAAGGRRKTLVAIFMRGAVDGVNMVVPYGERSYYDLRPTIAIARPGASAESAIDLDGFFGLHPAMRSLKPFWDSKRLGIIHAAGSPDSTRSHFDAQDYMESGTPGRKSTPDGWLNRLVSQEHNNQASPFRAVSVTQGLPRSLQGAAPALTINDLESFTIRAGSSSAAQNGFEAIYEASANDSLAGTGRETLRRLITSSACARRSTHARTARNTRAASSAQVSCKSRNSSSRMLVLKSPSRTSAVGIRTSIKAAHAVNSRSDSANSRKVSPRSRPT